MTFCALCRILIFLFKKKALNTHLYHSFNYTLVLHRSEQYGQNR